MKFDIKELKKLFPFHSVILAVREESQIDLAFSLVEVVEAFHGSGDAASGRDFFTKTMLKKLNLHKGKALGVRVEYSAIIQGFMPWVYSGLSYYEREIERAEACGHRPHMAIYELSEFAEKLGTLVDLSGYGICLQVKPTMSRTWVPVNTGDSGDEGEGGRKKQ